MMHVTITHIRTLCVGPSYMSEYDLHFKYKRSFTVLANPHLLSSLDLRICSQMDTFYIKSDSIVIKVYTVSLFVTPYIYIYIYI